MPLGLLVLWQYIKHYICHYSISLLFNYYFKRRRETQEASRLSYNTHQLSQKQAKLIEWVKSIGTHQD